ncbi:MAG: S16 family serine protease, partial [Candidatus Competibacterales bacterium]
RPCLLRGRWGWGWGAGRVGGWTARGGASLSVEATRVAGEGRRFKLTGRLGEVMQESAAIAYSYIISHLQEYGADRGFFDGASVHLHVPEGATPKDGPSAGITMASALLSLARGEKAQAVAMTGELTLTGEVLAVGGIREKIVAARRNKVKRVLLPAANRGDFDELPAHLKKDLEIDFVGHFKEVVKHIF